MCLALSYSNLDTLVSTSAFSGRNSGGGGSLCSSDVEHILRIKFKFPSAAFEKRFRDRRESAAAAAASIGGVGCHEFERSDLPGSYARAESSVQFWHESQRLSK